MTRLFLGALAIVALFTALAIWVEGTRTGLIAGLASTAGLFLALWLDRRNG